MPSYNSTARVPFAHGGSVKKPKPKRIILWKGKVKDWQTMTLGMSKWAKKGWPKSIFYKFYTPSDLKVFTAKEAADNFKRTKSMMGWNW